MHVLFQIKNYNQKIPKLELISAEPDTDTGPMKLLLILVWVKDRITKQEYDWDFG